MPTHTFESLSDYLASISDERRPAIETLRSVIMANLPEGFEETLSYNMIGYVVPHTRYPAGYHCTPELPLPFINLASQKNYIALYHSAIYADDALKAWFVAQYAKHCRYKLDMGKSCIRFKRLDDIPYALIGELASKMTVDQWIALYESQVSQR